MKEYRFSKNQIPNYISVFRILLIPVYVLTFFGVLGKNLPLGPLQIAGIVFLIAGFSDALDGFLARHNGWITDIGKLLDPFADKLLEVTVAVCIAIRFRGPFVILAAIIITKEIIMIVGAYLILSKVKFFVSAVWCGKIATLVWYLLICLVHFFPVVDPEQILISNILCIILILVMVMAFVIYVLNYANHIQNTKNQIIRKKQTTHKDEEGKENL